MSALLRRSRRAGLALALVAGLTLLVAVASPLLGDQVAGWFGPTSALANETSGGGG